MNGASQKGILIALGVAITSGVAGAVLAHENAVQILGFCTLVCVSLFSLLTSIRQAAETAATRKSVEDAARKASEDAAAKVLADEMAAKLKAETDAKLAEEVRIAAKAVADSAEESAKKQAILAEDVKRAAASQAEQLNKTLATSAAATVDKLDSIAKTGDKTHTLVNSNYGVQLQLHATATRRLASMTKEKADEAAADKAEKLLKDHDEQQAKVDAKEASGAAHPLESLAAEIIRRDIAEVPEKTAVKVVDKIDERKK